MDQMHLLPYELLQLVASNLLPRSQCRLAMTSRYCYKFLYNDLLQWHARKQRLSAPRCKHRMSYLGSYSITLTERARRLIGYEYDTYLGRLVIYNFTDKNYNELFDRRRLNMMLFNLIYKCYTGLFDGFYRYLAKEFLISAYNHKNAPILSLPDRIISHIQYHAGSKLISTLLH